MENQTEIFEFIAMSKKITQKEVEDFLTSKNIQVVKTELNDLDDQTSNNLYIKSKLGNIKVTIVSHAMALTELELLKGEKFPKHSNQIIRINFWETSDGLVTPISKPKEDEVIEYKKEYHKLFVNEYERKLGSDGLIFTNTTVIDKQRATAGYLIKNIGLNLIKGKSIMNVSLPINIFDTRAACQNAYAATMLEEGGKQESPLEKIKYSTAFAITRFHLSGAQLKPFNPILGETFQAKILDTNFYMEQISHHPPIVRFYAIGKNYKLYGYNESEASTGANSVKIFYKGNFTVEYADGTKHTLIFPDIKLAGSMVGNRSLQFRGQLLVIDEKNDIISQISLDPDDRGFFKKMVSSKQTYPDYFKGSVTLLSKNTKYDKKENIYKITDRDKHSLCPIEGEFTQNIKFDGNTYWQFDAEAYPSLRRMAFTMPSDSTFREDLIWWKKEDEDAAQRYKVKLEEVQRNEKKLREQYSKKK